MEDKERIRMMEVLLEDIRSELKAYNEGNKALQENIGGRITELRIEMNKRFTIVDLAIKNLSVRAGNLELGHRNLEIGQVDIKNELKKIHFRLDDIESRRN